MSQPPDPAGDGARPSWMGAPGYSPPPPDLMPHAPMPGAPPYPANEEHPPPPVGERRGTRYRSALLAAAVWAVVDLAVVVVVVGPFASPGAIAGGLLVPAVAASLPTWLVVRRRGWPIWAVVPAAAPFYWVLRFAIAVLTAAGS